jgi:hypothetical protein
MSFIDINKNQKAKMIIKYTRASSKVNFESIKDRECFYSGGILYMKILQQDLNFYNIKNVNAISIINAGLTFFEPDETVYKSTKEEINI